MKNIFQKLKKPLLVIIILIIGVLIFSQTALGKRLNLPAGLIEAVKVFFAGNPNLSACDYKDGTIILIKPIKTGVGDGAYEAGDIVEIRDGTALCERFGNGDPLGKMEKTNLLPVYYPAKLTEEQKRELTAPDEKILGESDGEVKTETLKRRKTGVDYTQFLSESEVLKVRSFEKLDRLPEIDLSAVIDKKSGLSLNWETKKPAKIADSWEFRSETISSELALIISISERQFLSSVFVDNRNTGSLGDGPAGNRTPETLVLTQSSSQTGPITDLSYQIKNNNSNSVVQLSDRLAKIENFRNSVKKVVRKIIPFALAGTGGTKTICTSGCDYTTLNAWEGTEQGILSEPAIAQITEGFTDTTAVTINGFTTTAANYIKIYTTASARHPGYSSDTPSHYALRTNSSGVHSMTISDLDVIIDGLEIKQSSTGTSDEVIRINEANASTTITNSLLYFNTRNSEQDIIYIDSAGVTINLENVIAWNAYRAVVDVYNPAGNVTVNINSSSFYNIGWNTGGGDRSGCIGIYQTTATITANMFNTLCHINTGYVVNWYIAAGSGTMTIDRSITNVPDWDTGVTSVVTDSLLSHNWTDDDSKSSDGDWVIMRDLTTAPYNFLLATNAYNEAQDAHADSSGAGLTMPSADIVGTSRPQNTNYDIGADEFVAASSAKTIINKPQTNFMNDDSLVGYWSFDGAATNWGTNKTNDLSGNANHGTMTNMSTSTSPKPGISGQALSFDGVDDYVTVNDPGSSSLDITGQLTLSAWIYKTGNTPADGFADIVVKANTDSMPSNYTFSIYDVSNTEYLYFYYYTGGAHDIRSTSPIPLNTWQHVAVIYNDSANSITFFINGSAVSDTVLGGTPESSSLTTDDMPVTIGWSGYTNAQFPGLIDEVRIYNRALSASEVSDLYRAGAAKLKVNSPPSAPFGNSGLVGYWSFDGSATNWSSATAGTTNDLSGNNNTGTLTNMSRSTSPVIGKLGQALNFDGSNDYVAVGDSASLDVTNITMSAWVKSSTAGRYIMAKDPPSEKLQITNSKSQINPVDNLFDYLKDIKEKLRDYFSPISGLFKNQEQNQNNAENQKKVEPQQLTHLRWEPSGRTFKTGNPDQYVYKSSIGQRNIKLAEDSFAPYLWDEENKTLKFADSSIRFNQGGLEFFYQDKEAQKISFYPETKKQGVWLREKAKISNPRIEEIKTAEATDYIKISYDIETGKQKSTIAVEAGGANKAIFAFNTQAKEDGEHRLAVEQNNQSLEPIYYVHRDIKEGDAPIKIGYVSQERGFRWEWQLEETKDRYVVEKPDKLAMYLNWGEYAQGENRITYPDQWGATGESQDGDASSGGTWFENGFYGYVCAESTGGLAMGLRWTNIDLSGTPTSIDAGTQIIMDRYDSDCSSSGYTVTLYAKEANNPAVWSNSNSPWDADDTTATISKTNACAEGSTSTWDAESIIAELVETDGYSYSGSEAMNFPFIGTSGASYWCVDNGGAHTLTIVYTSAPAGKTNVPYGLNITSDGKGQIMFMSSSVIYSATSTTSINDNQWHHVLGTYDGDALRIYVDGVLEDTNSSPSGNLPTDTGEIRIGADYQATPANFFSGLIDEVRIYNRALGAGEIQALYQAGVRKVKFTP